MDCYLQQVLSMETEALTSSTEFIITGGGEGGKGRAAGQLIVPVRNTRFQIKS